jgi:acyl-CoA reductase-like NAD-dependent aldehyde dehydrogenase
VVRDLGQAVGMPDEVLELPKTEEDRGFEVQIRQVKTHVPLRLARQLKAGMVGINATAISDARIPFGGVGSAGFGREGSKYGVADYLQLKHLC